MTARKKAGRKKVQDTQLIAVKLTPAQLKAVDGYEKRANKSNRSEALRDLIQTGLDAKDAPDWIGMVEILAQEAGATPEEIVARMRAAVVLPTPTPPDDAPPASKFRRVEAKPASHRQPTVFGRVLSLLS